MGRLVDGRLGHSWLAPKRRAIPCADSILGKLDGCGTANGVLHRFMTLSNPQHVFVGAWSHGGRYDTDPYRPNDASADPPLEMQWLEDLCFLLETHLQGRPGTARSPERLLTYFTMGEERWKTTTTWPPPGTEDRSWYFAVAVRL